MVAHRDQRRLERMELVTIEPRNQRSLLLLSVGFFNVRNDNIRDQYGPVLAVYLGCDFSSLKQLAPGFFFRFI